MSHQQVDQERVASLYENLTVAPDRFDLRFPDIVGLESLKTLLQETFYSGIKLGDPSLVTPVIEVRGTPCAGVPRFGRAIAGELHDQGFAGTLLSSTAVEECGFWHDAIAADHLAGLLTELRSDAPIAFVIEHVDITPLDNVARVKHILQDAYRNGEAVVCILITNQDSQYAGRQQAESCRSIPDIILEVPEPDLERRSKLLEMTISTTIQGTKLELESGIDFEELAMATEGFTTADLERIGKRSGQRTIQEYQEASTLSQATIRTAINHVADELVGEDHAHGNHRGSPASSNDYTTTVPDVSFADIGGMDDTISRIRELITFPEIYPELSESAGLSSGHGLLFYGPPGTGKTLLAKATAAATDRTFFALKGAEVKNLYFGETERRLRALFEAADGEAPSIIFVDEFDALAGSRDSVGHTTMQSVVNTLLTELDGLDTREDILFIGATNRREALDEAVLRPGRIGEQIEFTSPDRHGQAEIFAIHSDELPCAAIVTPAWFARIAPPGLTGAQIEEICKRATMAAMRANQTDSRDQIQIKQEDVGNAINEVVTDAEQDVRGFW